LATVLTDLRRFYIDLRPSVDPRKESLHPNNLRSINLAISARGITALRSVDPALADELLQEAIPMKGRMIHHKMGNRREAQAYDPKDGEVSRFRRIVGSLHLG